jgi:L-ribulose-5-phosphate 3-epimerase
MNRRDLFQSCLLAGGLIPLRAAAATEPKFRLSLAEWSLHKAIQARFITNQDFPRIAR